MLEKFLVFFAVGSCLALLFSLFRWLGKRRGKTNDPFTVEVRGYVIFLFLITACVAVLIAACGEYEYAAYMACVLMGVGFLVKRFLL